MNLPHNYERHLACDNGTWFVANLEPREGKATLKEAFYDGLKHHGFELSIKRIFGKNAGIFIAEFSAFVIEKTYGKSHSIIVNLTR